MKNKYKVKFKRKHLKELCYWIVIKFKEDSFHQQFGHRRDLLGGFIDRWINKAPEFLIFDKLLENKKYSVVPDYYLYKSPKQKNSPDILGLKSDRIIRFTYYENGMWKQVEDMPSIEVKTFRKSQKLITIPLSQFEKGKYYVIVESHITEDYLLSLFNDDFFDEDLLNKITMDDVFVEADENNDLILPKALNKTDDLGYYELLGIYKGKFLLHLSQIVEPGVEFRYLKNIQSTNFKRTNCRKKLSSGLYVPKLDGIFVPISLEVIGSDVYLLNEYKSYLGILVEDKVIVNSVELNKGYHKLIYGRFSKTSEKKELVLSKGSLLMFDEDSTEDLISIFDDIFK